MRIGKNTFISFVVASKTTNERFEDWELKSPHRPRFGRNWWFWMPSLTSNGGKFKSHENTDINLRWLCFCVSITMYASKC